MADKPVTVVINFADARDRAQSRLESADNGLKPKTEVNYHPAIGPDCCGVCSFGVFKPGENVGTCSKVAGTIRWRMVSDLYMSRTAATSDAPTDPA